MIEIGKNICWVGIKDWGLRHFHGHELSVRRGTSYNSYIVKDEKTVLVDTVWDPFKEEYADMLDRDVGLGNIDMIVINHAEPDHGGSLEYLLGRMPSPDVPVFCSRNGAEIIRKYMRGRDANLKVVKTGDRVSIGRYTLVFMEMQMLHWPDSMLTYVDGASVMFSNDAFGQHYAAPLLFNDEVDNCALYEEAIKYYANILTPFSALVKKKIEQIRGTGIRIDMIAPSHGVIWRTNPVQILDKYYEWSQSYNEGTAVIIYDTMYGSTRAMAEAMGSGLAAGGVTYGMFNAATADQSDLVTEIFKAKGVIVGSCTVNNTVMRSTAGLLEEIKGHKFTGKLGAGFGSYGWSGESPKHISACLETAGLKIPVEPLGIKYRPAENELERCAEFGKNFARAMSADGRNA